MRRIVTAGSLGALLAWNGAAQAQDELPPLAPPSSGPAEAAIPEERPRPAPNPGPSANTNGAPAPPPPADSGPMLAVPGIPFRSRVVPGVRDAPRGPSSPAIPEDLPPISGPSEMPATAPGFPTMARPSTTPATRPSTRSQPLVLESVPIGEETKPTPPPTSGARPDPSRPVPSQPARRPSGLFGRFLPPVMNSRGRGGPDDAISVEPRSDPAADAALKRRLEKQIRNAYGDQIKSVEVRVVGRNVSIRGRASRFWQRRGLRRSLESLPSLSGYHAIIEVE